MNKYSDRHAAHNGAFSGLALMGYASNMRADRQLALSLVMAMYACGGSSEHEPAVGGAAGAGGASLAAGAAGAPGGGSSGSSSGGTSASSCPAAVPKNGSACEPPSSVGSGFGFNVAD